MVREMAADTKELWRLIYCLVAVLQENGGELHIDKARRLTAEKAQTSMERMYYVINSAQAERLVEASLRTSMVKLTIDAG
jgi:chemotaxis regulatin CheY-phosphate phosphatase CheZ